MDHILTLATTVLLESLSPEETDRLIDSLGAPTGELRDRIRTTADGNPLFVEEMLALMDEAAYREWVKTL